MVIENSELPWRFPRYDVELPMEYRWAGDDSWHSGKTINFSRSGLLFEAEAPLSPAAQIELALAVPSPGSSVTTVSIVCKGRVVRQSHGRLLAARISSYLFVRRES